MHRKFHRKMEEMLGLDAPFIVATVIKVRGSAVAKPGAKAIIDGEGRPVFGWVGGGCVESFVCAEAKEALEAGAPRVIVADLEDELSGVGLPCGGVMEIFIEPVIPRRRVRVSGESAAAHAASEMLERIGFAVSRGSPDEIESGSLIIKEESLAGDGARAGAGLDTGGASAAEIALSVVAEWLAVTRGASTRPLQESRMGAPVAAFESLDERVTNPLLVIIGHSNITEELAWLASRLGWRVFVDSASAVQESYPAGVDIVRDDADFSRLPANSEAAVIVATHHKGDHLAIERALDAGAWYVGLIASAHRSKLVRAMLEDSLEMDAPLHRLRTPSGLDLGATTPAEIALSIMSEVLACFHGRTGHR
ncbi:MAG: XdhC family protein [Pyrinomonadaceae bacterium]|nr:XdhC family protein [Pyrinomonadaceae bacterium]